MFFSYPAFYVFAKLVKPTPASPSLLSPAAEFNVEGNAHAADPIPMVNHRHAGGVLFRRMWRLLRHRYCKWERARGPLHYDTACQPNRDRWANRHLQRGRYGNPAPHLSVAEKRRGHHWRYVIKLLNSRHHCGRRWRNVSRHGQQRCWECDQQFRHAHGQRRHSQFKRRRDHLSLRQRPLRPEPQ